MNNLRVTQRWCSNCEGEGKLVDVEKHDAGSESSLPASAARELRFLDEDGSEPEYGQIIKASAPRDCKICAGKGYYFYIEEEERWGESLTFAELPTDVRLIGISGPHEWVDRQKREPVLPIVEQSSLWRE